MAEKTRHVGKIEVAGNFVFISEGLPETQFHFRKVNRAQLLRR